MTRPDLDLEVGLAAACRGGDDRLVGLEVCDWLVGLEVCDWLVGLEVCDARKPEYLQGYQFLGYLTDIRGVHGPVGPIFKKILVEMESSEFVLKAQLGPGPA